MKKLLIILSITAFIANSCQWTRSNSEEQQNLNPKHRFEFTDCSMTYNGTPFMIGESIHRMVEIFGSYDRKIKNMGHIYIWDSIGILMTTYWVEEPETDRVNNIYIEWNLDMSDDSYSTSNPEVLEMRKEMVERSPQKKFHGNILVDGVPLGRGMAIEPFLKKNTLNWSNHPFPILYRYRLDICNYDSIPIPKIDELEYCIRVTKDHSNIENFSIGVVYRISTFE
ncbi:hypothetical protein FACS189434_14490 [Bacteroidia bacterium]|nr:hypothetical protein FACS189434_14490 [Bacteroidia bacterium]